jgi:glycosyltransferase involved in cell wall biosynthesis
MRLGIVTDCTHYRTPEGKVCTENHILLRQLQHLSAHFTETTICCPFAHYDSSKVVTCYDNEHITFYTLPIVGGDAVKDKVKLLSALPKWLSAFKQLDKDVDVIYQRFPNNLNIPGFAFFWLKKKKVFATYTGTWEAYKDEPFTFKLQRWILRKPFRGPVWVYKDHKADEAKIHAGFSPSYSEEEWREEEQQVENRIAKVKNGEPVSWRFITVGTLINYKNQLTILKAFKLLHDNGFNCKLTVVGDGPMRDELNEYVRENNLQQHINIAGKKNHLELRQLYRDHDFVVQAPLKEGFGKVPIEGFFHGLIPVINNVSMAKSMVGEDEERGFLFDASRPENLADCVMRIRKSTDRFPGMILRGREYARSQTLEAWAADYYATVKKYYSEAAHN